jgi:hypothetical protein
LVFCDITFDSINEDIMMVNFEIIEEFDHEKMKDTGRIGL